MAAAKAMSFAKYPKPAGKTFAYGTAGFRCPADLLDSTFFRMGMLGALRSRSREQRLVVGLMVTASHNPVQDNGIKLVDTDGGMLAQSWEPHATALANAEDAKALERTVIEIAAAEHASALDEGSAYPRPVVLVGRDTRPHSERLAAIAMEGIDKVGGIAEDCGVLTTPQLHHLVRHRNGAAGAGPHVGPKEWASEAGYYEMLATAFAQLVPPSVARSVASPPLWVDAAGGVGAPKLRALVDRMAGSGVAVTLANGVGERELNAGCGAEHCQKALLPPRGFGPDVVGATRACSLDGDADR